jgi:hypothetical protein
MNQINTVIAAMKGGDVAQVLTDNPDQPSQDETPVDVDDDDAYAARIELLKLKDFLPAMVGERACKKCVPCAAGRCGRHLKSNKVIEDATDQAMLLSYLA